ncbi:hypothetical protein [Halomonas sp. KO116]|uniref:hypothetical protein n=1 Tax=Halomonas sp. KO116 TaxID=1504981 RepID=UPI0004E36FDE|nr:hypothetical protein [Halomonas sp. KO116]AJY53262.1 hypothetical protein KO116_P200155 [Halomonas sp. KO116]
MPIPVPALIIGAGLFLMRSSFSGILLGGVMTMAAMHLWPEHMAMPYEWVGKGLQLLGL